MKRITLAILALALAGPAFDQTAGIRTANFAYKYDLDAAAVTYCRVEGAGGDPFAGAIPNNFKVKTTGSSASVTEVTAGTNPFTLLAVNDVLVSAYNSLVAPDVRVLITRTDAANVILSSAVTWATDAQGNTGRSFSYYRTRCGTAATDGWIDVSGATVKVFRVQFEQGDIDGLEWRLECKTADLDAQPVVVFPGTATACGAGSVASGYCRFAAATAGLTGRYDVRDENPWAACRIGMKYQSTDTADTTTLIEQISASVTLGRQ